jgi:hypothetical protein
MNVINHIRYSADEWNNVLDEFSKAVSDPYDPIKEKIPYATYRRMRKAEGMIVNETDDGVLHFYDRGTRDKLLSLTEHDFYTFFYYNYYMPHRDYLSHTKDVYHKEEKDTVTISAVSSNTTNTINEASYTTSTSSYLNWESPPNKAYINDYTIATSNDIEELKEQMKTYEQNIALLNREYEMIKEKENKKMKGFNFDFGPCTNDNIKMSVYGLAVQNATGDWVSYDTKSGTIMNVDLLNFDGRKFMYKMPVAIKDIAKGDIVIHNKVPMFVLDVQDGGVVAVDVRAGEEKKILPTNSPFGFNFMTKVVSFFNMFADAPTPDTPFGNFLPFMMMGENGGDIDPFVLCMMMQNSGGAVNFFSNPMMMYFFMKDNKNDKDWLLPMMMMNPIQKPTANK